MITLNGEAVTGCEGMTVEEFVRCQQFEKSRIAIEINGTIISKREYETTQVHNGDVIEVVSFVGGG